jgi:branched-chain amino acid transport system ATP-binding protein
MLLEVKNLRAGYGPTQVLFGLDFAVAEGGVTALLGANGAGKTTTLRAVSGLIRPEGEVLLSGQRIAGLMTESIARLGVAHVPDGRGTFMELTVEENFRLGAYTRRDPDVGMVPAPEAALAPAGGHAFGRRAANAGHCARAFAAAQAFVAG